MPIRPALAPISRPATNTLPSRRAERARHQLQNGRFAAAGRPDQRDEFAVIDAQRGFLQRRHRVRRLTEGDPDLFQLDHIVDRRCGMYPDKGAFIGSGFLRREVIAAIVARPQCFAASVAASAESHAPSGHCRAHSPARFGPSSRSGRARWCGSATRWLRAHAMARFSSATGSQRHRWSRCARSTMAISASEPTVSVPLRGYSPQIFAGALRAPPHVVLISWRGRG